MKELLGIEDLSVLDFSCSASCYMSPTDLASSHFPLPEDNTAYGGKKQKTKHKRNKNKSKSKKRK